MANLSSRCNPFVSVADSHHTLTSRIPASDLVFGDIVHIALGNKVPADLRLIETSSDLKFDRSALTGESNPIPASVEATDPNCQLCPCIQLLM